jgi:hypothetical protein
MPRDKPRLELALYARPKHPGSPHYALLVSPKSTKDNVSTSATKHHVKNTLQNINGVISQPWRYERVAIPDTNLEQRLLVRVVVAKVILPIDELERIVETLPVYRDDEVERMEGKVFSCKTWVRDVLDELVKHGAIAGYPGWEWIERKASDYVEAKMSAGRWDASWDGAKGVPMLDLGGRELVP